MTAEEVYIAIIVASIATYSCRALGVFFSKNISTSSDLFNWVKCISIGVIVAVISRMILFPIGILEDSSVYSRLTATILLISVYFISKKNILLSVFLSTLSFVFFNYYFN